MQKPPSKVPTLADVTTLVFCAYMGRDIFGTWFNTYSFKINGLLLFLIWVMPLLLIRTLHYSKEGKALSFPPLSLTALLLGAIGWLGSLRVLTHLGLEFSLLALFPQSKFSAYWGLSAICWLPASRWLLKPIIPHHIHWVRLAMAVFMLICYFIIYQKKRVKAHG